MSGLCPFAVQKIIAPGSNDPAIKPRAAILHVDAGNAESLEDYFRNRSGGIESHFFIRANGGVEQYRDIYRQADANLDANDFAVSIETQGYGPGEWSLQQLASIKRLLTWLHTEAGIPLRKIQHWDGSGVGYHTLFGAPGHWTPVAKTCPGPARIRQFDRLLVPWMDAQAEPAPKPKPATPRPLRVCVVNGMSGSGVSEGRSLLILHAAAQHADVVLGCEFGNVTDDAPLDPKVWDVVHDPSSPDRAGSLLAVRKTRGKVRHAWYRVGAPAGLGIRTRWLLIARLVIDPGTPHEWTPKVIAGHAPPKRAWAHWPAFMASVAARNADVIGADFNKLARAVAPALRRRVRAVEILGVAVRKSIPVTFARGFDVGGDHRAVSVVLFPKPKESR